MCADDTAATKQLLADIKSGKVVPPHLREGEDEEVPSGGPQGPAQGAASASPRPGALCYYGYDPKLLHLVPTGFCHLHGWRKYGYPGGVVCEGAQNVAQCPRPWE